MHAMSARNWTACSRLPKLLDCMDIAGRSCPRRTLFLSNKAGGSFKYFDRRQEIVPNDRCDLGIHYKSK